MPKKERNNFSVDVTDSVEAVTGVADRFNIVVTFDVKHDGQPFFTNVTSYRNMSLASMQKAVQIATQAYGEWPVHKANLSERDLIKLEKRAAKILPDIMDYVEKRLG